MNHTPVDWKRFPQRFVDGEWRSTIFRDMILADVHRLEQERGKLRLLDIGCGKGFDGNPEIQRELAAAAGEYIGVEPDLDIELESVITTSHRCLFEDAPIPPGSIDIAFSVMVLEHVQHPEQFWAKINSVLSDGGVFWGFTMDARHWFVYASLLTDKLGIKDWYLERLHGKRGDDRYENYQVYYRSNKPGQLKDQNRMARSLEVINFGRVGQMDFYFPSKLRWVGRMMDRIGNLLHMPGTMLAVRVEK